VVEYVAVGAGVYDDGCVGVGVYADICMTVGVATV